MVIKHCLLYPNYTLVYSFNHWSKVSTSVFRPHWFMDPTTIFWPLCFNHFISTTVFRQFYFDHSNSTTMFYGSNQCFSTTVFRLLYFDHNVLTTLVYGPDQFFSTTVFEPQYFDHTGLTSLKRERNAQLSKVTSHAIATRIYARSCIRACVWL